MKIAIVTDDGQTISQHFGRALHYAVYTIEEGQVTAHELRDKAGHHHAAGDAHDHGHSHEGADADHKHNQMIAAITDCEAAIVRGMGRGAYLALENAQIKPVVTDIPLIEDAVQAYIAGTIVDHTEKLH